MSHVKSTAHLAAANDGPIVLAGRYRLLEEVGSGGMATVYRACVEAPGGFSREVAVKLVRPEFARSPDLAAAFISEARLGGLLRHQNVVQTLDLGTNDSELFLVMEYVDGPTLRDVLEDHRRRGVRIGLGAIVGWMIDVCRGLEYAHGARDREGRPLNVVHRDLKPSNLMLDRQGAVKIADFGVARSESNLQRTQFAGMLKGTVRYMSPEQAFGEALDHRADIFSLGLVLFELLTLEPMYPGRRSREVLAQAQAANVGPRLAALVGGGQRAGLLNVLARALAPAPEHRFANARLFREALARLLPGASYDADAEDCVPTQRFTLPPRGQEARDAVLDSDRSVVELRSLHQGLSRLLEPDVQSAAAAPAGTHPTGAPESQRPATVPVSRPRRQDILAPAARPLPQQGGREHASGGGQGAGESDDERASHLTGPDPELTRVQHYDPRERLQEQRQVDGVKARQRADISVEVDGFAAVLEPTRVQGVLEPAAGPDDPRHRTGGQEVMDSVCRSGAPADAAPATLAEGAAEPDGRPAIGFTGPRRMLLTLARLVLVMTTLVFLLWILWPESTRS